MKLGMGTTRLQLRPMTFDDVDRLALIFQDPVAMRHYPSLIDRPGTLSWIQRVTTNYERFGYGLLMVERKADGEFLGQCGFIPQTVGDDAPPEPEIAYLFVRRHWGQGYATEAARACRDWGFAHLAAPRLLSIISIYNEPSIRVAERNGMSPIAEINKPTGVPHRVYAITREEWLRLSDR
jgi:RimJ/RimL family protein N-acetyltransferase